MCELEYKLKLEIYGTEELKAERTKKRMEP
jgi:hypothetical protein